MGWMYFETAKEVVAELKETIEKQASFEYLNRMEGRIRELMEKVLEFEKRFECDECVRLGYFVIYKPYNIFVKVIIAEGNNEPEIELIDIEEWLRELGVQ
jgi:hypothetical protein